MAVPEGQIARVGGLAARAHQQEVGCPFCLFKSESCALKIFKELLPEHLFVNRTHGDYGVLELDEYCKKLVLVFEYDGVQHEGEIKFLPQQGRLRATATA